MQISLFKDSNHSSVGNMVLWPENQKNEKNHVANKVSLKHRERTVDRNQVVPSSTFKNLALNTQNTLRLLSDKTNEISEKFHPLNFIKTIAVLKKAVKIFKFRTKFRPISRLPDHQMALFNDIVCFPVKKSHNDSLRRFTEKNFFKRNYYRIKSSFTSIRAFDPCLAKLKKIREEIPIIKPNQRFKVIWDILVLHIILFYFLVIPMQLSFDFIHEQTLHSFLDNYHLDQNLIQFIVFIPELILILDSLLKFITGYYSNGLVITSSEHIVAHYLKKGFIFDLLSYFPIILQSLLNKSSFALKVLQLLMFLKVKRIKIIVGNFQEMISLKGQNDHILSLIKLIIEIFFFAHITACIWHFLAYYNTNNLTWLDFANIRQHDWLNRYFYSLFWAVSSLVTIGYGEKVAPQNELELIIATVMFLVSSIYFGYNLNCMREIFDRMNKKQKDYRENINVINNFMKQRGIAFELQGRVRKYLEYIMNKDSNSQKEQEVLNKLTKALRNEVVLGSNGKYLHSIPIFRDNFSSSSIDELSFFIKNVEVSPEEYIFQKNQKGDSIFIVEKGDLEYTFKNDQGDVTIKTLKEKEIFGAFSFFTDESREITVRSKSFSTLFELKKSDFLSIIRQNHNDYEKYCHIRDEIKLRQNLKAYGIMCFTCSNADHQFEECPFLHYNPDRGFLVKRLLHSQAQIRKVNYIRPFRRKFKASSGAKRLEKLAHDLNESIVSGCSITRNDMQMISESDEEIEQEKEQVFRKASSIEIITRNNNYMNNNSNVHHITNLEHSNNNINELEEIKEDMESKSQLDIVEFPKFESSEKMLNPRSSKRLIKKAKIFEIMSNEDKINGKDEQKLFDTDFDTMKNYEFYHKDDNPDKVIRKLNLLRRQNSPKSPKRRANQERLERSGTIKKKRNTDEDPQMTFERLVQKEEMNLNQE